MNLPLLNNIPVLEKQYNDVSEGLILNENIIKTREQYKNTQDGCSFLNVVMLGVSKKNPLSVIY